MIASLLLMLAQPAGMAQCDREAADRGVQQAMNMCAAEEFAKADAALNAQWKETRLTMKGRDQRWAKYNTPERDRRPGYFASLLEAQRAWLAYRDAHCRLDGYFARGGSLEPLLVSTCKTALTEERTRELRSLVEND